MKKIFVLFLFITACGYQPLYINKNSNSFSKIEFIGDKKIAREILNFASLIENSNSSNKNVIVLNVSENTIATSKDSKGKVTSYKTNITATVEIKNNEKIIKNKKFEENFSYNNLDNKYDLSNYRKDVQKNLARKIAEDLIIFINLQ